MWLYLACARTKKQAKRQAATQLLKQLSDATDLVDGDRKNHQLSAALVGLCQETTLASYCHLTCSKILLSETVIHGFTVLFLPVCVIKHLTPLKPAVLFELFHDDHQSFLLHEAAMLALSRGS